MSPPGAGHVEGDGALTVLSRRLAPRGAAYALGSVIGAALALVQLVVLTRILPIDEFGNLAILLFFSGLVTLIVRICGVQGTLVSVFRGADEGDDDVMDDVVPDAPAADRELLGTGLALSLLLTAALTLVALVAAEPLDRWLISSGEPRAITWAALAGGLEGVWRLLHSVPRYERRPSAYVALDVLHAGLRLGAAIALVEAGFGLAGATAGLAIGSALSLLPALAVSGHRFRLSLDRSYARLLLVRGRPLALIAIGFWALRDTDVFLVSRLLPSSDVALYRAASRMALPVAYLSSALLLAWGPLTRGPLRGALHRQRAIVAAGARLATYYWLLALMLIVGLTLASPALVHLAPPDYAAAGPVIPYLAVATAVHGAFVMIYRTVRLPEKARLLRRLLVAMVPLYAGLVLLLIPPFGLPGAAGATTATALVGAAVLLRRSQTGKDPLPLPWARLGLASTLAGACLVFTAAPWSGRRRSGAPRASSRFRCSWCGPARSHGETRGPCSTSRVESRPCAEPVPELAPDDLVLVELLAWRRRSLAEVAVQLGQPEEVVLERFVAVLRATARVGSPTPLDGEIARYLLDARTVNARDRVGHRLALRKEVGLLDVDALTAAFEQLRRDRPRTSRRVDRAMKASSDGVERDLREALRAAEEERDRLTGLLAAEREANRELGEHLSRQLELTSSRRAAALVRRLGRRARAAIRPVAPAPPPGIRTLSGRAALALRMAATHWPGAWRPRRSPSSPTTLARSSSRPPRAGSCTRTASSRRSGRWPGPEPWTSSSRRPCASFATSRICRRPSPCCGGSRSPSRPGPRARPNARVTWAFPSRGQGEHPRPRARAGPPGHARDPRSRERHACRDRRRPAEGGRGLGAGLRRGPRSRGASRPALAAPPRQRRDRADAQPDRRSVPRLDRRPRDHAGRIPVEPRGRGGRPPRAGSWGARASPPAGGRRRARPALGRARPELRRRLRADRVAAPVGPAPGLGLRQRAPWPCASASVTGTPVVYEVRGFPEERRRDATDSARCGTTTSPAVSSSCGAGTTPTC